MNTGKFLGCSSIPLNVKSYSINCNEEDKQRFINESQMWRVTSIKHLGLLINDQGELPHETNIAPIENAMNKITDSITTLSSSPLGRAIFAKFLLASRYLQKIHNYKFSQLSNLRDAVLRLTWSRHRMGTDTTSHVHIANSIVAQPLSYGVLAVPNHHIQYTIYNQYVRTFVPIVISRSFTVGFCWYKKQSWSIQLIQSN